MVLIYSAAKPKPFMRIGEKLPLEPNIERGRCYTQNLILKVRNQVRIARHLELN